jgi:Transposase DDE domain
MRHFNQGRFRHQVQFLRRQFIQDEGLPFTDILSEDLVAKALSALGVFWKDRIYTPLVTLWVFLSQVLSADHSCRAAVARLIAHLISRGEKPCSAQTGAYCQARERLPEKFFAEVACSVGRTLDAKADSQWLWKGRRVYMFDGTTVTMPDTPENQDEYPQVYNQKPGLGFPIARLGAIISLACGAILNLGLCRYAGKGQGEVSLLRRLWDILRPGDVLLTDCLLANWTNILLLQERGVELVSRLNKANRTADFRRGQRLGHHDHIVRWFKPTSIRSLDRQTYNTLPAYITIRETRIRVRQPGFRTKSLVVVTTLLDPQQTTKEDLATLYRARWHNELDVRSIKSTMQMRELRCKTPELVRKEIWTHVLAYNLIRTIMAQAAAKHDREPRSISFKGAMQTLEAFQPLIELRTASDAEQRMRVYHNVLDAIATHRVADRPDRFEPRAKKQRRNHYDWLTKPRAEIKRKMAKGFTKI